MQDIYAFSLKFLVMMAILHQLNAGDSEKLYSSRIEKILFSGFDIELGLTRNKDNLMTDTYQNCIKGKTLTNALILECGKSTLAHFQSKIEDQVELGTVEDVVNNYTKAFKTNRSEIPLLDYLQIIKDNYSKKKRNRVNLQVKIAKEKEAEKQG